MGEARRPLLVVGASRPQTGFGRVLSGLLPHLSRRREVHQIVAKGRPAATHQTWTCHESDHPGDPFGTKTLREVLPRLDNPTTLILQDVAAVPRYLEVLQSVRGGTALAYCPIDGPIRCGSYLSWSSEVARLIVYTESARRAALAAGVRCRHADHAEPGVEVIPHGLDTSLFFPLNTVLADRLSIARCAVRDALGIEIAPRSFVVLTVARNQARKRIDLAIEAFAHFARGKPGNVLLWLHTEASGLATDVPALAHSRGIADRLVLTSSGCSHPGVDDRTLNLIYNCCDVGLSASAGEAWGLASFEHAATAAPQVMPHTDTAVELWPQGALLVNSDPSLRAGQTFAGVSMRVDAAAAALDDLYRDADFRASTGAAARMNAAQNLYSWEAIADRWDALVEEVETLTVRGAGEWAARR